MFFTCRIVLTSFFSRVSAGNTMMIIMESMSNGALDSFLRVRL